MTAKKYDWKDSNLALFGSDLERNIKKDSAKTEKAWTGAGEKIGLKIWRIVQFKVTHWPKDQYGQFYNGDSYIVLNTYTVNNSEELHYDIHFWIGQYSTADEYGTAAYKTVELDTLLDNRANQHREVMGYESNLFKNYFKRIELLEGGAESGFRHVGPAEYVPRLLHFHGLKQCIEIKERPLKKACLDDTDVFILDLGTVVYQWNGIGANKDEKFKAAQYLAEVKSKRGKCTTEVLDEFNTSKNHVFYQILSDDPITQEEKEDEFDTDFEPSLFRLSDATGEMLFTLISKKCIRKSDLDPMDGLLCINYLFALL